MAYMGGEEFAGINELIRFFHTLDRPDKRLQICMNICQILDGMELDDTMRKEIKSTMKFIQELLTNPNFRRAVNKRTALMEREPITYFGDTIAKSDMYDFDEELERDLTTIDFRMVTFLGNVMKFIQGENVL